MDSVVIGQVMHLLDGKHRMNELQVGWVTVRDETGRTLYPHDVTLEVSASGDFVLRFDV